MGSSPSRPAAGRTTRNGGNAGDSSAGAEVAAAVHPPPVEPVVPAPVGNVAPPLPPPPPIAVEPVAPAPSNNNIISIPGTTTHDRDQLPDWFTDALQQNDAHPSNRQRALPISSNNKQRAPPLPGVGSNNQPAPKKSKTDTVATSTNKKRALPIRQRPQTRTTNSDNTAGNEPSSTTTRSNRTWEQNYALLVEFNNDNGHCRVPLSYDDKVLGNWVQKQRRNEKLEKLSQEQIGQLESIGFEFDTGRSTRTWDQNYALLVEFNNNNGHCDVPATYAPDKVLGNWVQKQRRNEKLEKLSQERIGQLESIGFEFDTGRSTRTWDQNYALLVEFNNDNGHCRVPAKYEDKVLGQWVQTQRNIHNNKRLQIDRFKKLDKIDFSWAIKPRSTLSSESTQASRVMVAEEEVEQLLASESGDDVEQGDTDTVDAEQMEKVVPTQVEFL